MHREGGPGQQGCVIPSKLPAFSSTRQSTDPLHKEVTRSTGSHCSCPARRKPPPTQTERGPKWTVFHRGSATSQFPNRQSVLNHSSPLVTVMLLHSMGYFTVPQLTWLRTSPLNGLLHRSPADRLTAWLHTSPRNGLLHCSPADRVWAWLPINRFDCSSFMPWHRKVEWTISKASA